ncbi:MAG: hypothetical protein PHX74_12085 [Candidatus Sumerlaeales bacterium]|nr:hypothetical protein [Candidatus Sumerlaeales bacterium]
MCNPVIVKGENMGIYITPLERIRKLQAENARLRSLVGEPAPVEPVEDEMAEREPAPTLVEKTDTLEADLNLIAEVLL